MTKEVYIYRNLKFDGRIYVKLNNDTPTDHVKMELIKDGVILNSQETTRNFAVFKDNNPGVYKAVVDCITDNLPVEKLESKELKITEAPIMADVATTTTQNMKGGHMFYDNVDNYYLEIKLKKDGLDKLKAETNSSIPKFFSFLNNNIFEQVPNNVFFKEEEYELYKIKHEIPKSEIIAIAEELENLDYVVYCSVSPDTTNMPPPPLLKNEQLNVDIIEKPFIGDDEITPDFTPLQTYLHANTGMNILNAWNKGITGEAATVRHLDHGVYKNHEDLTGNITVVHSRSEDENCHHGTASTGVIAANKNHFGVTGIAHNCKFFFYDTDDLDLIIRDAQQGDTVSLDIQFDLREQREKRREVSTSYL
ncbi:MAG: S8 family serine peptidase [Rickettsia endosymbiont of Glossina mortisans submortisans]|nr:S8 family serine peptidase [Rickettsia endosymbiont of Glossina mortisans submortisans]